MTPWYAGAARMDASGLSSSHLSSGRHRAFQAVPRRSQEPFGLSLSKLHTIGLQLDRLSRDSRALPRGPSTS
jgi:hypothetical protein